VKDAAFQELLTSVRQAGRIRRGTLKPSRTRVFQPADVRTVRATLGVSQTEFALMIGVSVATLRNWEQGRRVPEGQHWPCSEWRQQTRRRLQRHFTEAIAGLRRDPDVLDARRSWPG
jgi:putative transcriptional regulator